MAGGNPLVAEVAVEFVDAVHAADEEALEVEFRRDAQEELHVERVVVRDERLRRGAPRDGVHHRRLHLQEPARIEELPQKPDDLHPRLEDLHHVRVRGQVRISLTVPDLHVGQSVPLLGRRRDGLGENRVALDEDRYLAGAGLVDRAFDANEVPEVDQAELLEGLVPHRVLADVSLDAAAAVAKVEESRLALQALRGHPPRHADAVLLAFFVFRHGLAHGKAVREPPAVGLNAEGLDGLQFLQTLLFDARTLFHGLFLCG